MARTVRTTPRKSRRCTTSATSVAHATVSAGEGTHLLLASDGLLALATDYGRYDADGLFNAALSKGLAALGEELRAIEESDPEGRKFARLKKSDDATALILRVTSRT